MAQIWILFLDQPCNPTNLMMIFVVWNLFNKKKKEEGKTMEKTVLSGKCVPHNCQFKFSYLSPNLSVHLSSFWSLDPSVNSP